jgi:hypothetical protein
MIDFITKQRITVEGVPLDGAHIIVPQEQWPSVSEALTRAGVKYWVGGDPIVVNDEPPVIFVVLSRSADGAQVQQILDSL